MITIKLNFVKIKSTYYIILILNAATKLLFQEIRIGHSELTHKYLLKGEQQPECIVCDCP